MLQFRLFGFPIQIHVTFLILGLFVLDAGFGAVGVILWMAAVALSVLVHELGHAFTARWAGGTVTEVVLYGMGGLTSWTDPGRRVDWWRRVVVSLAGAGAGFVLGGIAYAAIRSGALGVVAQQAITTPWGVFLGVWVEMADWPVFFAAALVWTSLVWGVVNLLPIGGLDGSHVLGEILERVLPDRGRFYASIIGLVVAVVAAVWFFRQGATFAPLIFLFFAISDLRRVQAGRSQRLTE